MKFRITGISDTHNKHNQLEGKLPGGDILIHAGDITSLGRKDEVKRFIKWFSKQEYKYKVFIAGNHDMTFDNEKLLRDKLAHFEGRTEYDTECAEGKPQWLIDMLEDGVRPIHLHSDMVGDSIKIEDMISHNVGMKYQWILILLLLTVRFMDTMIGHVIQMKM
jgi:predicted phosphodiesterase